MLLKSDLQRTFKDIISPELYNCAVGGSSITTKLVELSQAHFIVEEIEAQKGEEFPK